MQHKHLLSRKLIDNMLRGSAISSNKGALADENAFTEKGDSLNYPRNHHDGLKKYRNCYKIDR